MASNQDRADAIRRLAVALNEAMQDAINHGLTVEIEINELHTHPNRSPQPVIQPKVMQSL